MEDCNNENSNRKRVRDDSDLDSPESKRVRVDSDVSSSESKRVDSEEPELNTPEENRIRDDILGILDDADPFPERDPEIQDLDLVIRSFEEEILHLPPSSESGESQPDLGYLLEASDDELGLPPAISPFNEQPNNDQISMASLEPEVVGLGEILAYEAEIPSYDPFSFGIGGEAQYNNDGGKDEFVTLGGLFDYTDPSDFSEFPWRPESLPAI